MPDSGMVLIFQVAEIQNLRAQKKTSMTVFNALLPIFTDYGYIAVFTVLLICGFGLPVPEDVTLVTGGVIAGLGFANEHYMVVVGMAGVLIGDGLIFTLGRVYGEQVTRLRWFARVLPPTRIAQARETFSKYGKWVMFVARFLPGLRTPVFFTAGMTRRVSYTKWFVMDGAAALISVPVWVYLGYFGARNFDHLFMMVSRGQSIILGALLLGALVLGGMWWRRRRGSA
jgi:membrane protein DedA with SNARE-associated domain